MKSSPWFHQRRSESAPPTQRTKEPPSISLKEQEDIVERLSRPTESARYRKSLFWKLDGYMEKGFHSWSKMELFEDSKQCMWTPDGTIKNSCKIRPVNYVLPPLSRSNGRISRPVDQKGAETARSASGLSVGLERSSTILARQAESRGEARRTTLRPRPSLDRSRTNFSAMPVRQSHHAASGPSFRLQNHRGADVLHDFSSPSTRPTPFSQMAVPRVIASNSTTPLTGH